jgi:hypothetical protein
MRTDDIVGAGVKKFFKGGLKTLDFYPEYPEINRIHNESKLGGGGIPTLSNLKNQQERIQRRKEEMGQHRQSQSNSGLAYGTYGVGDKVTLSVKLNQTSQ